MNSNQIFAGLVLLFTAIAAVFAAPDREPRYWPRPPDYVDWTDRRIVFVKRIAPWRDVMKWFAEQTKSTYQSEYPVPGGILDFDPPNRENGEPRTYTLAEIFDIINDVLICEHKFILLRSEKTLTLFPADAEIPASFFQRVRLHDLKYHAKSELVEVAVKIDPRFAPIARNGRDILPDWPQLGDGYALVQSNVRSVERFLASGYFSP